MSSPEMMVPSSAFLPAGASEGDGHQHNSTLRVVAEDSTKSLGNKEDYERAGTSRELSENATERSGEQTTNKDDKKEEQQSNARVAGATQGSLAGDSVTKRVQLPVSDRHVYKHRCPQCSLAFKTPERLQAHLQYHVIRAATACALCQRSFRSIPALRKHLESSHPELADIQVQQLCGSLQIANGDFKSLPETEEELSLPAEADKDEDSDPDGKQSPTGSDGGIFGQEDPTMEAKRAVIPRKCTSFAMEKFLDPSRPYKCTVCKESFTQKNILLVHYNSVSHLHRLKKALQESSSPGSGGERSEPANGIDNKPYKCMTCNVAYSQSSTLEIHMRSVLHQTRARAAKLEAASGSGSGSSGSATTASSSKSAAPDVTAGGAANAATTGSSGASKSSSGGGGGGGGGSIGAGGSSATASSSSSSMEQKEPADGNRSLSSSSSSSALQNEPAPRGNGGAAAALPLGASTVTSASSRRASGVQTSPPPWDSCSDESESELSRASEDSERPAGSRAPRAVAPLDSGSTGSAQLATDFLRV